MKLRNKKTGEIRNAVDIDMYTDLVYLKVSNGEFDNETIKYHSLAELNEEWEDYYEEPKKYKHILPNKVRRAILCWVRVQDNPIEKISILLQSYYDTHDIDSDGFYDYEFFGYVGEQSKNKVANTLTIRLKKPFAFDKDKDYTLEELGISGGAV